MLASIGKLDAFGQKDIRPQNAPRIKPEVGIQLSVRAQGGDQAVVWAHILGQSDLKQFAFPVIDPRPDYMVFFVDALLEQGLRLT